MVKNYFTVFILLTSWGILAQNGSNQTNMMDSLTLSFALKKLEKKFNISFSYAENTVEDKHVFLPPLNDSLTHILHSIRIQTGIQINKIDDHFYYLSPLNTTQLDQVVISSYITKGINKKIDGTYIFEPPHFGLLPGMTDNDIMTSLQYIPGVVSPNENIGNFLVHGGNPDENGFLWDGIRVFHKGYLLGTLSPFNPNAAHKVKFIYKGTPVEYYDFISSILDIQTRKKIVKKTKAQIGINGLNFDVLLETPVIANKMSFQGSFRRSYEEILETYTSTKYKSQVFQNTSFQDDKFYFKDYNIKLNFKPNPQHYLGISAIHLDNDLEYYSDNTKGLFYNFIETENNGISLNWHYQPYKNKLWKTRSVFSKYRFFNTYQTSNNNLSFTFYQENIIKNANLQSFMTQKKNEQVLKLGFDIDYKQVFFLFKETENLQLTLSNTSNNLVTLGLFGSYQWKKNRNWNITTGLRTDYFTNLNKVVFEPRLKINKYLNQKTILQFTAEIKYQPTVQIRQTVLSDYYLNPGIWKLSDRKNFPLLSSYYFTSGLIFFKKNFYFDLDLFYKHTKGLTSYSLGFFNNLDPFIHHGQQRAFGMDIFVKKKSNKFSIQSSYSFLIAKRKFEGINHNNWFVSSNQIKHSLNFLATYSTSGFSFSASTQIRSGLPYTELEIEEDFNEINENENFYEFENINQNTLPTFYTINLSGMYRFSITEDIRCIIKISLQNVTSNRIQTGIYYIGNNAINDKIQTIKYYSIGIIPNFSIRFYL